MKFSKKNNMSTYGQDLKENCLCAKKRKKVNRDLEIPIF